MQGDVEALVLSGDLFNPNREHDSSPARSPSPDTGWHDDEYNKDSDSELSSSLRGRDANSGSMGDAARESIGMGPGRTGVKGVIRDRAEVTERNRTLRERGVEEVRWRMERIGRGGMTALEEDREKRRENGVDDEEDREWNEVEVSNGDDGVRRDVFGYEKDGTFGHLREVGMGSFVAAVEREARGVWVVVHLYEPTLPRCYTLDGTLARLARVHRETKFVRARASTLGFASKSGQTPVSRPPQFPIRRVLRTVPGHLPSVHDDEFDEEDEEDEEGGRGSEGDGGPDVDTDVLPTMLVYRNGQLVHNWVRVDWEAGRAGVEELLAKNHIIPRSLFARADPDVGQVNDADDDDDDDDDELLLSD